VTPQFGASLADNSRVIIYDRNMFIVQATESMKKNLNIFEKFLKTFVLFLFHSSALRVKCSGIVVTSLPDVL
jgi:hypothetical protein